MAWSRLLLFTLVLSVVAAVTFIFLMWPVQCTLPIEVSSHEKIKQFKYIRDDRENDLMKSLEPISLEMLLDGKGPYYIAADNPALLKHIRRHVLQPPSTLPYNLTHPEQKNSSPEGQIKRVNGILNNKKGGFFIEAGALTGEFWSNTLTLERFLDWTGLLVEPSLKSFQELMTKHRKAWSCNCCLSPFNYPVKVVFDPVVHDPATGNIVGVNISQLRENQVVKQCYPILSLLLAINQTTVDYCSLDIQGPELDVIKALPLDQIDVKLFSVEYANQNGNFLGPIVQYLTSKGYKYHSKVLLDVFMVKSKKTS